MRKLLSILAFGIAFAVATPASATGGLVCATAGASRIDVAVVIGHATVSSVVSARLTDNGRGVAVTLAQAWLDSNRLLLDLTDPNRLRHELRINVRRSGNHYDGTLWRNGQRHLVRCREG